MKALLRFDRILFLLGLGLLAVYVGSQIHRIVSSWVALRRFDAIQRPIPATPEKASGESLVTLQPKFALWAEKRIRDYQESLERHFPPPVAVLRIPKIELEAPVWEGTDDLTLNRGVGWIEGTEEIEQEGQEGNVGIAGHRDGFFRGLKDLQIGDTMDLVTKTRRQTFVIDQFQIVSPKDVSVLQPTPTPSLTLVTCYPFYFTGSAPKRYIVHASIKSSKQTDSK